MKTTLTLCASLAMLVATTAAQAQGYAPGGPRLSQPGNYPTTSQYPVTRSYPTTQTYSTSQPSYTAQPSYTQPSYAQPNHTAKPRFTPPINAAPQRYAAAPPYPSTGYAPAATQTPVSYSPGVQPPAANYYNRTVLGASAPARSVVVNDGNYQNNLPAPGGSEEIPTPYADGDYGLDGYGAGGCDTCNSCGDTCNGGCGCSCCGRFFGWAGAISMTRDNPNTVDLSLTTVNPNTAVLSTADAGMDWTPGWELGVGYYLGCNCNMAVAFSYWGLEPFHTRGEVSDSSLGSTSTNTINTTIDTGYTMLNTTTSTTTTDTFDAASAHSIERWNEFHNYELNFLVRSPCCNPCSPFKVSYLAGFRAFTFDERLLFGAATTEPFGTDPATEGYFDVDVENELYGFQLGADIRYSCCGGLGLYFRPKFGIYGNYMTQQVGLYTGDGINAQAQPVGDPPVDFPLNSSKDDLSFLGELDLGIHWQVSQCWSMEFGYRAVAISGLALADHQYPRFVANVDGLRSINSNGSMILHGVRSAIVFNY